MGDEKDQERGHEESEDTPAQDETSGAQTPAAATPVQPAAGGSPTTKQPPATQPPPTPTPAKPDERTEAQKRVEAKQAAAVEGEVHQDRPPPSKLATVTVLVLVASCLACTIWLATKLMATASATDPNELALRFQLSSLAVFVGLAFACLGFGLFLLGASGSFSARMSRGQKVQPWRMETTAPGLVFVVCATVIIWVGLDLGKPPAAEPAQAGAGGVAVDAGVPGDAP